MSNTKKTENQKFLIGIGIGIGIGLILYKLLISFFD